MPYGVFPVPRRSPRSATDSASSRLTLRVRTRIHRGRLDRALAGGADPGASPELEARAIQLLTPAERARLADALLDVLGNAGKGDDRAALRTRAHRTEVLACADELLALAVRLRGDVPVQLRGVALASRLVGDKHGPLYRRRGEDLRRAVLAARNALDATSWAADQLRAAA